MTIFQTAPDQNAVGQSALNDLVGEGKKFKTPDDLAKAKLESDRFIEKLQNEQRELREELSKRLSAEEALKRAREAGSVADPQTPPERTPPPQQRPEATDIGSEVDRILRRREQETTTKSNIDSVTSKMKDLYGSVDKAAEIVQSRAQELGMSVSALQTLASENPKAFFKLVGVDDKPAGAPQTSSWQNTKNTTAMKNAAGTSAVSPGTYKWYNELRKTDPAAFFSPRVQLQMDKDAREKGEKFYS